MLIDSYYFIFRNLCARYVVQRQKVNRIRNIFFIKSIILNIENEFSKFHFIFAGTIAAILGEKNVNSFNDTDFPNLDVSDGRGKCNGNIRERKPGRGNFIIKFVFFLTFINIFFLINYLYFTFIDKK